MAVRNEVKNLSASAWQAVANRCHALRLRHAASRCAWEPWGRLRLFNERRRRSLYRVQPCM